MNCTIIFPNNLFEDKSFLDKQSKVFVFQDPLFFNDEKYPNQSNKKASERTIEVKAEEIK